MYVVSCHTRDPWLQFSPVDCEKLYRNYGVSVRNCVELSLLARTVDNARWKGKYTNKIGLARLVETYEGAALLKGKTRCSNWEDCLNDLQQECKLGNSLVFNSMRSSQHFDHCFKTRQMTHTPDIVSILASRVWHRR